MKEQVLEYNDLIRTDIVDKACDSNTLSYRLCYIMRLKRIGQSELAGLIGVKAQVIQYLCSKNIKSSRFTYEIAEALGVSHTWLAVGEGPVFPLKDSDDDQKYYKIPIIQWEHLSNYKEKGLGSLGDVKFVFSNVGSKTNVCALTLDDNAMSPRFESGTIVIIDLNEEPVNNDFVVAKIAKYNMCVFRQLKIGNETKLLIPFNHGIYKDLILDRDDVVFGTMIQSICNHKRD
jgi:phage repressor protein C with HTH and peptisase S24 domain